ncbi:hypothetical protein ACO0LC_26165 [Undibacterium sp. JH2W]|uniref:hypothetical protein n=1 Tax=Undibacterium sp. JH2W TaxID=3413037 RepID=UPI003BF13D6E
MKLPKNLKLSEASDLELGDIFYIETRLNSQRKLTLGYVTKFASGEDTRLKIVLFERFNKTHSAILENLPNERIVSLPKNLELKVDLDATEWRIVPKGAPFEKNSIVMQHFSFQGELKTAFYLRVNLRASSSGILDAFINLENHEITVNLPVPYVAVGNWAIGLSGEDGFKVLLKNDDRIESHPHTQLSEEQVESIVPV